MEATRTTLFQSATLTIGSFEIRPITDACGDVETQNANVIAIPLNGVFLKHHKPGHYVTGTSGTAVLIPAETPYRLSFPGAIGDRALILRFDTSLAPEFLDQSWTRNPAASVGLLPADAIVACNLLWRRLARSGIDHFEAEALGLDLLGLSLASMRGGESSSRCSTLGRRDSAINRVREAIAMAPDDRWDIATLARLVGLSPFHLCRVFRAKFDYSLYDYVLRERLVGALARVRDGDDLTTVALDAGFASHSHFTSRFRRFFGCTPALLRRSTMAGLEAKLGTIMTAPRSTIQ